MNHKFYLLLLGLILLPTLACGSVGVYNPEATQVAIEGTVVSLQATIIALESNMTQSQSQDQREAPVEVVVTTPATPTAPAPATSETVIPAASLGQTIQTTDTPTSTPTPVTITSQDRVITLVATFTPSPTPEQHSDAPIIIGPQPGTVVEEGREIQLHWSWNGILKPGEFFDIKIKPDGQTRSAYVGWERGQAHTFKADVGPGRYFWTVQVLRGHYKNNSDHPDDRVFEGFTSPESEPRLIIVAERDDRERRPTRTPTSRPDVGGSEAEVELVAEEATSEPDDDDTSD